MMKAAASVAMLGWLAGDALAEPEPEPEPEAPADGSEVIVIEERWVGVSLLDAEETGRAVTVVTPRADQKHDVIGEHLEEVPGVALQKTSPGQAVPIIRGLIGSAVLVVVDGIRLNNAIFRPAPNQYNALLDPWWVDEIVVLRGSGAAPYGSDALGGVVEIETPLPVFESDRWASRQEVIAAAATGDLSAVTHGRVAVGRRGIGILAGVTAARHDDLRNGDGTRLEPSEYAAYSGALVVHRDTGSNATTGWFQLFTQPELHRTDELRPGFGQDQAAAEVWAYRPSRRTFGHVRHVLRRPARWLDGLELHAAYQRIDDARRIRDTGATTETREWIVDHGVTGVARAQTSTGRLALLGGIDGQLDLVTCRRDEVDVDTGASMPIDCRFPDGSNTTHGGGFGEARFGPTERWQLRAAVRGGLARTKIPGSSETTLRLLSADWAGEAGAEFRATGTASIVANVGRGFRVPNVNDLAGLGPRPGNRYQVPVDSLANEHATGADVGVRVRTETTAVEAFAFGIVHDDRIDVVPTGEMTADGREIVASANVGRTTIVGVEAAATVTPVPELALAAALGYARGTQVKDGDVEEPADRCPPLGGSLAARWSPTPRLALELGGKLAAAQRRLSARDRDDPRIDPEGTPAFAKLHASAAYSWPSWTIAVALDNITDEQYREHGSGVDAPGVDLRVLVRWRTE
jgi:outer membrane receptor protein involved in Fe transport